MIRFSCPGCSATYNVADEKAGKTGKCPKCQSQFIIPMPEGGVAPPPLPPAAVEPPPLPSAAAGPVEINPCPKCQTRLTVEAQDLGSDVQCPTCNTIFKAVSGADAPPLPPPAPPKKSKLEDAGRRDTDDDEEDEKPRKKRRWSDEDDDDDDRPRKRRRDDDDDEEDDRPRKKKKKRSRSGGGQPHRGMLILILGILSWACCGIFTSVPCLIMANADLRAMDEGIMDNEGRGLTFAGRILALINIGLTVFTLLVYAVIFVIAIVAN